MSTETASPLSGEALARTVPVAGHRRRAAPDDHLCTCGRLRDDCLRETVRLLWN